MIFTTTTQAVVLLLMLLVGWCLGMLSAPRRLQWKKRYEDERDAHAAYRTNADAKLRDHSALTTNHDASVRELEKAKADLTIENERLAAELAALKANPRPS